MHFPRGTNQSPLRNPVLKIEIQLMTTTRMQPQSPVKKAPSMNRIIQTANIGRGLDGNPDHPGFVTCSLG